MNKGCKNFGLIGNRTRDLKSGVLFGYHQAIRAWENKLYNAYEPIGWQCHPGGQ